MKDDLNKKILELFGGIGAPRKAFNNLKINIKSDYVEFDNKVVEVYNLLYNEKNLNQDVRNFKSKKNKYNYLIAGFPCQPFSQAGKRLGFNDERGKLYKDTLRIIKETLPDNIILENVKGILRKENIWIIEEIINYLKKLDYYVIKKIINSQDLNYLQKRERIFIIASKIKKITLNNFNEFIIEEIKNEKEKFRPKYDIKNFLNAEFHKLKEIDEKSNFWVIPRKSDGKLINGSYNRIWKIEKSLGTIASSNVPKIGLIYKDKLYYRRLTPKEAFLHMGFDLSDYEKIENKITKNRIYHVSGNSMVVGVMEKIIKYLEFY
ncbi:DNA (cytosine-5-)-methyltransferase [Candidatus Hepatoplasma crinochetorum]|uniref:DNA (cytosine-5-)-methyltransferase n=1 Tax=Candidatus Hepatoplasma crinochetorum TaxID=295596 RepID=UPI00308A764B|nr:MAG: cytosine-specific methyltransferase [Candidatus Hepatoplasma crinochetorum]